MRSAVRLLARAAALIFVWVALWGSPSVGNLLSGVVVVIIVFAVFPSGPGRTDERDMAVVRPLAPFRFLGRFFMELVMSTISVAIAVIAPRRRVREGVVKVRLRSSSPVIGTIVANAITLTPGTLTVDAETDRARGTLLQVHVLGLDDPEGVRSTALDLERLAIAAFGSTEDRDRLRRSEATSP
ncbi:MAG: Na+/H+ antiporter subunit E [Acidimicrobiia bacterium]|nr:Na+/H+ antiporter subunit E [Acidimicrobiia bacterium]